LIAAGQLDLGAAVISARTGDASGVRDYLDEAERYADQTGEDLETFWFGFGPTNATVHRVITMIELGDYSHAIHLGEFIQFPSGWLPTRIGRHHFDLVRAYQRMNLPDQSMRHPDRPPGRTRPSPPTPARPGRRRRPSPDRPAALRGTHPLRGLDRRLTSRGDFHKL
jgi:hypothetical protein